MSGILCQEPVCLTVWTKQGSLGPDTMILVTLSLCSLWTLALSQSLTSQGWSQSPVTDEDRRRLVGSFVKSESDSSEVSVVRPQPTSVIDTDPVLGEVIRHNQDGEPRPVRQQQAVAGQDQSEEGRVLQGFFVDQHPLSEDQFSTNFEAASEPNVEASEDLEQLIEYQYHYDYQEDQEAQEQTIHQAAHQHNHQPQFHPPTHIGIGRERERRSKISIVP